MEKTFQDATKQGIRVRAVLFTNPGNPLGNIINDETILMLADFTRKHGIHLVSDEIYALSNFKDVPFKSTFEVLLSDESKVDEYLRDYFHIMYALSKDFSLSGCRLGVTFTKNKTLYSILQAKSLYSSVSTLPQACLSRALNDKDWLHSYIKENSKRLASAYDTATTKLKEEKIPYIESSAGLFIVLDLRKYLRQQTYEEELLLFDKFIAAGVLMQPGACFHFGVPGYFRLIFTVEQREGLILALERVTSVLQNKQLQE